MVNVVIDNHWDFFGTLDFPQLFSFQYYDATRKCNKSGEARHSFTEKDGLHVFRWEIITSSIMVGNRIEIDWCSP